MSDEPSRELDTNTASRYNRYVLYSKYVIVRKGSTIDTWISSPICGQTDVVYYDARHKSRKK